MQELAGKVAVVTGAASGIGAALAARFAAERRKVVLADVEEAALAPTADRLRADGAAVLAVRTDVSRAGDVQALADRAWDAFGGVDVLCNNAGVFVGGKLWERSLEDWQWLVGVNLFGVVHGIRAFVPRMLAAGREGRVINTASLAGLLSQPFLGVYAATKHAIVNISETLHHELTLAGAKVRVSVLCPGMVNTRAPEVERNRPSHLRNAGPRTAEETALDEAIRAGLAAGMAPTEVAAAVVDAIRADRFWIFTDRHSFPAVRLRLEDVLAERNPTLPR